MNLFQRINPRKELFNSHIYYSNNLIIKIHQPTNQISADASSFCRGIIEPEENGLLFSNSLLTICSSFLSIQI